MGSRTFVIDKDPCDIGCDIYKKSKITINTGITVLVGCNGIGKTTLIMTLKEQLKEDKTPFIHFDNLKQGGSAARSMAGFRNDFTFLATAAFSSEGENIFMNMERFAKQIVSFIQSNNGKGKELWVFIDAVDSGYSVDNIEDVKDFFHHILKDYENNNDIYFIISANEYEMARNEECFDVLRGNYKTFKTYEAYRKFILKTREEKNNRKYR